MSAKQRLGVLALFVVAAAAAFLIARPGDDAEEPVRSPAADTAPGRDGVPTLTTRSPESLAARIKVQNGEPVGGVRRLTVLSGERIRFSVQSPDTTDEVHLHGYNVSKDMAPGAPVRFDVPATIEGVFEVELEGSHVKIATLVVEPR